MSITVDQILEQRLHRDLSRLWRAGVASALLLHLAALLGAVMLAHSYRRAPEPLTFVNVQIVPLQARGSRRPPPTERRTPPPPAAPEPTPSPPPPPKPQAEPPPPSAEPKPSAADREEETPAAEPPAERRGSPEGSAVGTSTLGTTLAGLGDPSFTYDYYVERMLTAIEANWRRPSVSVRIQTVLYFRISREGHISDLRLVEASGNNGFDLAALRAVENAGPLPPLPAKYRKDSLEVTLIVR